MPHRLQHSMRALALGGTAILFALAATGCPSDKKKNKDTGIVDADAGDAESDADVGVDAGTDTGVDTGVDVDAGPPGEDVSVRSFGVFPPTPANCSAPGQRQRIPFYFTTRQESTIRAIKRGDILNGEVVVPQRTVSAGTLTNRRMRVADNSRKSCEATGGCKSPLKCGESGIRGADKRCTRQTGVEFIPGSARLDYRPNFSPNSGQLVTILVEDTAMWKGKLPSLVGTKYDENGEDDFGPKKARATDPELKHREAIKLFARTLDTAANPDNTKVSMWFLGGENRIGDVRPLLNAKEDDHFTNDLGLPKSLVKNLGSPAPQPANIYQGIIRVVNQDFKKNKYKDHEKFLVLFTDSPNEVYDKKSKLAKVRKKLRNNNVHLFVIHLDASIDPTLLRDDPRYWKGTKKCRNDSSCKGAPICTSDDQCASYETCRKATIYADTKGGTVKKTGAKYCMPDYSEGHLGPIAPYADLACASGGNYLYTTEPSQMKYYARRLPYLFDGQWSVEAEFSALSDKVGLGDGFYRLSGAMMGLLSPNLTQIFSLPSKGGKIHHLEDSRPLLRKGMVPEEN